MDPFTDHSDKTDSSTAFYCHFFQVVGTLRGSGYMKLRLMKMDFSSNQPRQTLLCHKQAQPEICNSVPEQELKELLLLLDYKPGKVTENLISETQVHNMFQHISLTFSLVSVIPLLPDNQKSQSCRALQNLDLILSFGI